MDELDFGGYDDYGYEIPMEYSPNYDYSYDEPQIVGYDDDGYPIMSEYSPYYEDAYGGYEDSFPSEYGEILGYDDQGYPILSDYSADYGSAFGETAEKVAPYERLEPYETLERLESRTIPEQREFVDPNKFTWENVSRSLGKIPEKLGTSLMSNLNTDPIGTLSKLLAFGGSMYGMTQQNKARQRAADQLAASQAAKQAKINLSVPKYQFARQLTPQQDLLTSGMRPGGVQWFTPGQFTQMAGGGTVEGALSRLIEGPGGGQDDKVPISASDGEYVFDAETVSALGDGSTKEGADRLDKMRQNIRKHKRSSNHKKVAPKARNPESYLKK